VAPVTGEPWHALEDARLLITPGIRIFPSGSATLSARITCSGKTHGSGSARLWFGDGQASSRFGATIGGVARNYYPFGTWSITLP
jgi:hypothetical protein